jgi:hypothetical protein
MTSINDFDRVLGQWLDEGPTRAPDRSIELALDHARAHPRRRDPLAFLRPDPMARRSSGLALRPVLVLAVLGLLLAAVAAIGIGRPRDPAVVLPPEPSTTSVPASPSPTASALRLDLIVPTGQAQTVEVVDGSGLVVEATSGAPTGENGQSFPFDSVEVSNLDPTTLQLGWAGFPCETDHTLTIEADGRAMTLERPACVGDTDLLPVDRILVLRFSKAVAAAEVNVALVP